MDKRNRGFTLRMLTLLVIVQLYFPLSDLWDIRNAYHNHKIFKDMISDKYSEKFKKRLIQNEVNAIVKPLEDKYPTSMKTLSMEKLEERFKERKDLYYMMRGLLYFVGTAYHANIQQDFTLAYESFKKAKELSKSSKILEGSDIQINRMLMYGIGVDANPTLAFQNSMNYKTDIAKFQEYNQYLLGYAYLVGKGTDQNVTKAYEYLKNAGEQAYSLLAFMYASGIGADKNMDKALELIKGSKNSNLTAAILYLSDEQYAKGKYYLKKCMPTNQKCQKLYHSIFKYDFYDKVLNVMSYIN